MSADTGSKDAGQSPRNKASRKLGFATRDNKTQPLCLAKVCSNCSAQYSIARRRVPGALSSDNRSSICWCSAVQRVESADRDRDKTLPSLRLENNQYPS